MSASKHHGQAAPAGRIRSKAEFTVSLRETTIGRLLRRLNFTRLQPRPFHPKKNAAAQELFEKVSPAW